MRMTGRGRPFDARSFSRELQQKALEVGLETLLRRGRAAAASLVDPATGRQPLVLAWRTPKGGVRITTTGSEDYALALEQRLDRARSTVQDVVEDRPVVYFAHASEDAAAARPIVEHLVANGVEVWFDEWEIAAGDSLRRKMDDGLGRCTHFVVLLSPVALKKAWVNEEIDAGFVRRVEGRSKFIPLRLDLPLSALPPLLKGMLSPEIAPGNAPALDMLVSQLHGVSAKPQLGPKPRYVQRVDELAHFSAAAVAVGKALAFASRTGDVMDPHLGIEALLEATGLSAEDVELGVLDLVDAGLVEEDDVIGGDGCWPLGPLFVTFDPHVHHWRPAEDARTLAALMVNEGEEEYAAARLAEMTDWPVRRLNAALHAVKAANIADTHSYLDGERWAASVVEVTPQTRRAARAA